MSRRDLCLGDGLYGRVDADGTITLLTERGSDEHYVVLEPQVLAAFEAWIASLRAKAGAR